MDDTAQGLAARQGRERHEALVSEALEAIEEYQPVIGQVFAGSLRAYLAQSVPPGGFLRAVLSNDFSGAVARAHPSLDMKALRALRELVFNFFPNTAWGEPERVAAWLAEADRPTGSEQAPGDGPASDRAGHCGGP